MLPSSVDTTVGFSSEELSVRLLTELRSDKARLTDRTFFDGGDVLDCVSGSFCFRFGRDRGEAIILQPGEKLVIYPGNIVSIESLKSGGRLRYLILNGTRVDEFLDSFGFYDHLKFTADSQPESFRLCTELLKGENPRNALTYVSDMMRTFGQSLRSGGRGQLVDAIKVIHRNLGQGVVRLKPVYTEMKISRATLHRLFADNGLTGPGEFLRNEQYRKAHYLLTATALPIGEVARRIGIPSPVYFTEFIRKFADMTPSELRRNG